MKLYYKTGTCSLAPHIVMAELNMVYELEAVDLATKVMAAGGDFRQVNPKGSVPALKMENGEILTEGAIINQYLADQKPELGLLPKFGTQERYRCLEWMNFIATDIHKSFSPLFYAKSIHKNEEAQNELTAFYRENLSKKLSIVSERLGNNDYLMGKQFTIADAYLFTCLGWSKHVGLELEKWKNISSYMARVSERAAVKRAMKESGLTK